MSRLVNALARGFALTGLLGLAAVPALTTSAASASETAAAHTCSGTAKAPGVLTGLWRRNVIVKGVCEVNAGRAVVKGNLTVDPGGALLAIFARNDKTHKGWSSLSVRKNLVVDKGAALALGCEPAYFACVDDSAKPPTLTSRGFIGGSLVATRALGVVVHVTSIRGSVKEQGGGGGLSCTPKGIFKLFKSPVYSDYEDVAVGRNLSITGLHSCWLGALRDSVHGGLTANGNKMADPDANEINWNTVNRSMTCRNNSPAVQYGDSGGSPNVVNGKASGQCRFGRLIPNPPPSGPLEPISIRSTS
jgi:hypothetical protein